MAGTMGMGSSGEGFLLFGDVIPKTEIGFTKGNEENKERRSCPTGARREKAPYLLPSFPSFASVKSTSGVGLIPTPPPKGTTGPVRVGSVFHQRL